jgi:ligand-binding SRPBCC domain-containing protein
MTYPSETSSLSGIDREIIPLRTTLFCSVLLLFGFIPFDLHWLALEHIEEGKRFDEHSSSILQKFWKHSRYISIINNDPIPKNDRNTNNRGDQQQQVVIDDELEFCPRIPLIGNLVLIIVKLLFTHRHNQLKRKFKQHTK